MSNQPSAVPTRKVGAGALGGAISYVLVWALGEFGGFELEPGFAVAVTTIISFVLSYFVPERSV